MKPTLIWALIGGIAFSVAAAPAFGAANPVRALVAENRLDEASSICRQFEVLSTMDNENFIACAWVYLRTDRLDSAEKMMDKLRRGNVTPEMQLLQVYAQMKRKQYDPARKAINALSAEYRSGTIGMAIQELNAELYEQTGQLDTAAFIYKQVLSDDPNRGRAHWGLGRYYLSRQDLSRAKTHLEQAARMWPKHLGSRYNLAVLHLGNDNLTEAARWLADCYRLNRADAGVLEQLGVLFEKKGMVSEAIKYWQRAADIAKDSTFAREKLALYVNQVIDALVDSKQYEQALAQIDSYGKNLSREPKLLLRRGVVYRNLGKYESALKDLRAYSNTNTRDPLAMREMGICYVNLKQTDQAGKQFLQAIDIEPGNGLNYAWMAYVLEARGKLGDARDAWKKATELLTDPEELDKANRRLAAIEKRAPKRERERDVTPDREEVSPDEEEEREPAATAPKPKKSKPKKRKREREKVRENVSDSEGGLAPQIPRD